MKKIIYVLALSLGISACNQKASDTNEEASAPKPKATMVNITTDKLASTTDYICGMPVENGSIADTADIEGKLYGFCSVECKELFIKDPQAHLSTK